MGKADGKQTEPSDIQIFDVIRADDFEQVKAIIEKDPSAVNAVAPKRPLDTRGMSPLQVSLCTGRHKRIAWLLLESGADKNNISAYSKKAHPRTLRKRIRLADMRRVLGEGRIRFCNLTKSKHCQIYDNACFCYIFLIFFA